MTGPIKASVCLVVAVARNGVIGRDNKLLWRLKTDLRRFRSLTIGRPVIMGRKTFESIGKPLPGRKTIVVSRDPHFSADGVAVASSIEGAFEAADLAAAELGVDEIAIAGGAEIYRLAMPFADRLYVTEVGLDPEGDAYFADVDRTVFVEVRRIAHAAGGEDEAAFVFVDYERRVRR